MAPRAVVFDLFDTLTVSISRMEYEKWAGSMARVIGLEPEAFLAAWRGSMRERMRGAFGDVRGEVAAVCRMLGKEPTSEEVESLAEARTALVRRELQQVKPEAKPTFAALRGAGYKVGLLKPEPGMYALACERLGASAEECVFVGDGASRELDGARAAGMRPVQVRVQRDRGYEVEWDGERIDSLWEIVELLGVCSVPLEG